MNNKLIDHLQFNLNKLTSIYPKSGVIIGGDINNLGIERLVGCYPDLVNVVTSPTHGGRILDVVVTDLHPWYDKACVLPPVQPDVEGHGKPSDHAVVIARPNMDKSRRTGFARTETRRRRLVSASNVARLVLFLACFDWRVIYNLRGVDAKLAYFQEVVFPAQELFCPMEEFVVRLNSSFPVSAKLAKLSRLKASEFKKNRYSRKFKALKKEAKEEKRKILKQKIEEAVIEADGNNSWLSKLEAILDPDGCTRHSPFILPEHRELGLNRKQQAEDYAKQISAISREYVPLGETVLPGRVQHALDNAVCTGHPLLDDHDVYKVLCERKLTAGVEGDLDKVVMKECMAELTHPVGVIYREAVSSHTWPAVWKQEKQIVIPKCPHPCTKDDMRNLGLSPFLNKGLEQILVEWLLPYVSRFISRDQYGGKKKCSTNHYLARLVEYIYDELDKGSDQDRRAVAAMAIDLSKAFNRLDHGKLVTLFFYLGVPPCSLRLLVSYLSGRSMRVHLTDAVSTVYELWGGGPQGGLLTILLFNLNSNWITDICQPGVLQSRRFLSDAPNSSLRCSNAQMRDCPVDVASGTPHHCLHHPKCAPCRSNYRSLSVLRMSASVFVPGSSCHVLSSGVPSTALTIGRLCPTAAVFVPGSPVHPPVSDTVTVPVGSHGKLCASATVFVPGAIVHGSDASHCVQHLHHDEVVWSSRQVGSKAGSVLPPLAPALLDFVVSLPPGTTSPSPS